MPREKGAGRKTGRKDTMGREIYEFGRSAERAVEGKQVDSSLKTAVKEIYANHGNKPADQLTPGKQKEYELVSQLIANRKEIQQRSGRKVIALDIDGVMADFTSAIRPYSDIQEDCPDDYNVVRAGWFKNFDDFEKVHCQIMEDAGSIPPQDDTAGQAVRLLQEHGHEVIAVTARREEWREGTLEFFRRNDIPIANENLHFSHNDNKTDTAHYDVILDDAPKNIIDSLANSDAQTYIYNHRYNEHLPGERVSSVLEFARKVIEEN